jgi:hypothetical protein
MIAILQEAVQATSNPSVAALVRNSHQHHLLLFLCLFMSSWFAAQLFPRGFIAAERFGSRLAKRRQLCIFLLPALAIVLRISLLWIAPIPAPTVHDEFSYLLAADTFAHGRLTNPSHPMWVYFDTLHVSQQPTYMSIFPPAQGAVLALGQLLGHPWIGVLLSVSVMTGTVLWALQGWFPSRWALLGGILFLLQTSISGYWINRYWGGAVAATGGALVFGALPRIMHSSRIRDALLLGLGASVLANSRPFEGLIFFLPVLAALVIWLCLGKRPSWPVAARQIIVPFCAVMFLCISFIGYYNFRLTGHPTLFPHDLNIRTHLAIPQLAWEKTVAPFHFQNPQFEEYYNEWWPAVAWSNGRPNTMMHVVRASAFNAWKFIVFFAYPALLVTVLAAPWILCDRRMRFPIAQLTFSFTGFLLVAYFLPHYAAPLSAVTFALIVQGLRHLRHWCVGERLLGVHLSRAVAVSALLFSPFHDFYALSSSSTDPRQRIAAQLEAMPGADLIVVRYSNHHNPSSEWVYNAADIDHAKIVWAREIPGVPLQPLLDYFPNRRAWIVEPDKSPPEVSPYETQSSSDSRDNRAARPDLQGHR